MNPRHSITPDDPHDDLAIERLLGALHLALGSGRYCAAPTPCACRRAPVSRRRSGSRNRRPANALSRAGAFSLLLLPCDSVYNPCSVTGDYRPHSRRCYTEGRGCSGDPQRVRARSSIAIVERLNRPR
jgi:hypothetical protein